ncbi:MAG: serine/threonine protein kinase [Deltaproteobacteria bacterium]|nr:serine/threonine protein kinase [Deltaproteobacteria bacterium]MBW2120318.1 serine/threonine protein kinase [Deltaproteobacteria bacterium]
MPEDRKNIVNSWNEWDPLKHIIVGRADGTMVQAPEPAVQRDWPEYGFPLGKYGPLPKEMEEKANEQLDNFAKILESRGVRVDRPTPLDFSQTVQTPDWVQKSMFGCMPPRDLLLTVGNEILEATMSFRSRWFEYLCYRPLMEQYFKDDPNMRWEAAPKPRLTERTYKKDFWKEWNSLSEEEKYKRAEKSDWIITEVEPLFDAADVVRCGKDLFVQKSMVTNDSGIDWLRRHYPNHRIHKVRYRELTPWHMDTTIVPLRPGLVLINPVRTPLEKGQGELFKKNDWEVLLAPKSVLKEKRPMTFCSIWLNMNLLVLDPKTVCVEASETPVIDLLDKHGFEVIPVPFYEVSPFGGGLHCATADVYREGTLEDYFPKQVEGF